MNRYFDKGLSFPRYFIPFVLGFCICIVALFFIFNPGIINLKSSEAAHLNEIPTARGQQRFVSPEVTITMNLTITEDGDCNFNGELNESSTQTFLTSFTHTVPGPCSDVDEYELYTEIEDQVGPEYDWFFERLIQKIDPQSGKSSWFNGMLRSLEFPPMGW